MPASLRIAIDARPLSIARTGIGRYTEELLRRLVETRHQWFLYSDRALLQKLPERDNIHIRIGRSNNRFASTLYPQLAFPIWARRDAIDVFWSPRHHLPLLMSSKRRTAVTVHDLTGFIVPDTMTTMGRLLETRLTPLSVRKADALIVDATSTARDMARLLGGTLPPISVVPLAATKNAASASMPRPLQSPYFLFAGTFEPRKNLKRMLQAYSQCSEKLGGVKLVLAGGAGWGDQQVERWVQELGIASDVVIAGRIDESSLHAYYRHALALVFPSLYEGFGLPLLEAMQYAVPVITSNRSSMPEVAGDGGLLVDPEDCASIGAALLRLAGDAEYRQQLSQAALVQAQKYSWDRAAQQTLEVLERV